jgi:hypothetical protein
MSDPMSVAPTIDLPYRRSSSRSAKRSGTAVGAVLIAAVVLLTPALLAGAYAYFAGAGDGFPDPTQQWTD